MNVIIRGKKYDTAKALKVASRHDLDDLSPNFHTITTLYLVQEQDEGQEHFIVTETVTAVSDKEAYEFAALNLTAEEFEEIYGPVEDRFEEISTDQQKTTSIFDFFNKEPEA